MASMKLSEADKREYETAMCAPCGPDSPDYPWGLRITLERAQLEALNLDIAAVKPGQRLAIMGYVEVIGTRQEMRGDREHRSLEAVITDLEVNVAVDRKSTESVLYDSKAE